MAERREYGLISKRSKQILGEEVLPKVSTSSCGKPMNGSSMQDKRRSQVLQAQRTHRQRTQTYIKMLEREVLRLRESERKVLEDNETLQKQVADLTQLLEQQQQAAGSQSAPPSMTDASSSSPFSPLGLVTANVEGPRAVQVSVAFPGYPDVGGAGGAGGAGGGLSLDDPIALGNSSFSGSANGSSPLAASMRTTVPDDAFGFTASLNLTKALLADPRVGIEFVLRLETDCMDHLRGKHLDHIHDRIIDSDSEFSGHVSTACLALWQHRDTDLTSTASYEISNSELERLLSSSLNLGLQRPEITPVQVWNRIRWLEFSGGREELESLTKDLKDYVYCLGFGAVLHETIVEEILKKYFTDLPPL